MPSIERDASRDSERHLKHQHSASTDRSIVPMWDSSDPERAPPPLPMNPSSPIVSASRPNTSSAIQSAHAALTEKARENGYITNPPPKRIESPERSLIKGAAHKRMQSLQTGNVRDLSSFLEHGNSFSPVRSPEKLYGRPSTPHMNKDFVLESRSPEKELKFPIELRSYERDSRFLLEDKLPDKQTRFASENRSPERESRFLLEGISAEKEPKFATSKPLERETIRSTTPVSGRETPTRDMPTLRPSLRRPPQSILSENAPPQSATMLALQNMATRDLDTPLADVTNGSTALVRTPQTFEAISTQILNITSIATSLQREMAQLSRRSKDNATDLVSLKEATNARDEDIRKSLRELVTGLSEPSSRTSSNVYGSAGLFLDNKAHNSPSSTARNVKAFSLPRIPSPNSFAASLDRETTMFSPAASYCHDGVTNIALLEKILREMSTREGQEQLAGRLLEVADRLAKDGTSTSKKLDELLQLIKDHHSQLTSQSVGVFGGGGGGATNRTRNFSLGSAPVLELDFDQPNSELMTERSGALFSNKENIGPVTTRATEVLNEDVLKLIRTIKDSVAQGGGLTAEVKALVRELRGEVLGMGREIGRKLEQADTASSRDTAEERDRVARVVQDGLDDLKEHMDSILREHRRQSASSIASNRVDYQEIFNVVRTAVNEKQQRSPELQKEEIVDAVKEAWENYKPEIELQQFGLEREELLTCLKEGIQEFCPRESAPGATRDEVFTAVVEGLKHFVPPQVETPASLSRDEILDAVRECLEEFEFPSAPPAEPLETGITRHDMLDAVNEGLHAFDFAATTNALSRNVEEPLTRDDMLDAVNQGLHAFDFAANTTALSRSVEEPLTRDDMLDAVKEGLHTFEFPVAHNEIDLTNAMPMELIVEAVKEGLATFDFAANTTALTRDNGEVLTREDVLEAVSLSLQNFTFPTAEVSREIGRELTRDDVFDAINEGLSNFNFQGTSTALTRDIEEGLTRDDVLDAVKEVLDKFDFSAASSTALTHASNSSLSKEDIYDAIKASLSKEDVYDAVKAGLDDIPQVDGFGGQIFDKLQEIMDSMTAEFHAVSEEAKQNVSAHGRDTEQVLDATKDGFEKLRGEIETYVDRALDDNEKDSLLEKLQESFESLRAEIELSSAQNTGGSLDAVQSELEQLRETMATSLVRGSSGADKDEILDAIKSGMSTIRAEIEQPHALVRGNLSEDKNEILEALRSGLDSLRHDIDQSRDNDEGAQLKSENILEAVRTGLDSIKADLEQPQALVRGNLVDEKDEIIQALRSGLDSIRIDMDRLRDSNEGAQLNSENILEAVRNGLDRIKTDMEHPQALVRANLVDDKDEIIEALRNGLNTIRLDMDRLRDSNDGAQVNGENILEAVRSGLDSIKTDMQPQALVHGNLVDDKDEIIEALRNGLDSIRLDMDRLRDSNDGAQVNSEIILEAVRSGLDSIKADMQPQALVRANVVDDKDEIIEALRNGLDSIRLDIDRSRDNYESVQLNSESILEAVKTGLERIKSDLEQPQALVRANLVDDKDEILHALRTGLDGIRMDIDRPRDNESVLSGSGEVLDALHDGLNGLRSDLEKIVNKPVDMTVNYEILDTLKLGLEGLRADIDRLRESAHEEQIVAQNTERAVVMAESADNLKRNDIENLEVLITQLRIKVEAFDPTPPPPPAPADPAPDAASKSDLEVIEDMLRNLQEAVTEVAAREKIVDEDAVKREDVISIETLLHNMKAKSDEVDPEQAVKKEHLDAVELLISDTQGTVMEVKAHLDDVSKRDDVVIVEGLVRELMGSLEEMKEKATQESQAGDKPTKTDIEAIEAVCFEVKSAIEQMILSDISVLATREDVKNLEGMVKEFKGRVEHQEVAIYKGFEERQAETVGVGERVAEIKVFLEEFRDALKEKLDDSSTNTQTVATLLEALKAKVDDQAANVSDEVKDLFEAMKLEFEKSNAGVVGSKLESDEKFQQTWDRFDFRLDEKFDELMTKYDDAQSAAEVKGSMEEQKNREIEAALLGTKAVAEDVKILIDTLGTTLTDSVEKMDESGKTVFNRVEDTFTRVEETHADAKAEHQLTREQVFKTLSGIEGVQGQLSEYNPQILESVKDILLVVAQHFEHSKTSTVAMQEQIVQHYEHSKTAAVAMKEQIGQHYELSKTSALAIQDKISEIPPPPEMPLIHEPPPAPEKYDDTPVHEKLDKLVDHLHVAGKSFAQLEMLDKIHQQVMSTAAEVSQFVSNQTQRIANDHEDKEKAVEAATIALEQQLSRKEHVETAVGELREEEERLRNSVAILKAEQEDLARQKLRLSADVASIETALKIRREELHDMECRAEGLERRIFDGVMNHSRALLISKPNKGRDAMSRKRVPSHAASVAGSIVSKASPKASVTNRGSGTPLAGARGVASVPINGTAGASRRILSLNQITHNVPTGNFKRSHSVKTIKGAGAPRKTSWGGSLSHKYGDLNKENLALKESEEDEEQASDPDDISEAGTTRRSSQGTTILNSTLTGATESTIDEGTEWTGSSVSDEEEYSGDENDSEPEPEPSQLVLYDEGGQVA